MDILQPLISKKNIIDENVYKDIENYLNSNQKNKKSVIFNEEKYDNILFFNNNINSNSIYPYFSLYLIPNCQILFNVETEEYILFFGDNITFENIKNVKAYNITKNWNIMKGLCINYLEDIYFDANYVIKKHKTN